MKTLLLLRHAKSSWSKPGLADFDRPLKDKGREAAALIGAYLTASGSIPDAIISSPALRARQTAEGVRAALDNVPALSFDKHLYEAPAGAILQVARSAGADAEGDVLMLVGHNPSMQMAAVKFCGEGGTALLAELLRGYPTAALASFAFEEGSWRDISWSGAAPIAFVSPKALRAGSPAPQKTS